MHKQLRNKGVVDLILHGNKINVGIKVQMGGEGIAAKPSPLLEAATATIALPLFYANERAEGRVDGTVTRFDGLLRSVTSCAQLSSESYSP